MSRKPLYAVCLALALAGCKKDEEKPAEETAQKADADKSDEDTDKKKSGEGGAVEGGGGGDKVAPESIPKPPLHSGVDLMLSFVPDEKAQFFIVRDATVIKEYWEEALRFLDKPVERLSSAPGVPDDVKMAPMALAMGKAEGSKMIDAITGSGLNLAEGAALINLSGGSDDWVAVFNAESPDALGKIAEAFGESTASAKCQALEGFKGWNVCADNQGVLDKYKPAKDPKAVRAMIEGRLKGIDLDDSNLIAHFEERAGEPVTAVVTTLPGLVHVAATGPFNDDPDLAEMLGALEAGEQRTLANVQPGAGFVWGRARASKVAELVRREGGGPPEMQRALDKLSGEFVLAGSVDPGGVFFQASISDASAFTTLIELLVVGAQEEPLRVDELPGADIKVEKLEVSHGAQKVAAAHALVSGYPQAEAVRAFTGLHAEGWAFAAGDAVTVAVGPDHAHVGKLMALEGKGPSADMLSSLPEPLAKGLQAKTVSFAAHMPLDFLQGVHFQKAVRALLKSVPEAPVEGILAVASVLSPVSSASVWFEQPRGAPPVMHAAIQAIGNRATNEGKAALDAAHAITDGKDPAAAFGPLASKYSNSAMAFAYITRAGTEGPGSLVGSGVGPAVILGALAYAGTRADAAVVAEELGVDPQAPDPDLSQKTLPQAPGYSDEK